MLEFIVYTQLLHIGCCYMLGNGQNPGINSLPPSEYPKPFQESFSEQCNRYGYGAQLVQFICDPDRLLSSTEANNLHNAITRQEHPTYTDCSQCRQISNCSKKIRMEILLSKKIQLTTDAAAEAVVDAASTHPNPAFEYLYNARNRHAVKSLSRQLRHQDNPLTVIEASWLPETLGTSYGRRTYQEWRNAGCEPDILILCYNDLQIGTQLFRIAKPQVQIQLITSPRLLLHSEGKVKIRKLIKKVRNIDTNRCYHKLTGLLDALFPLMERYNNVEQCRFIHRIPTWAWGILISAILLSLFCLAIGHFLHAPPRALRPNSGSGGGSGGGGGFGVGFGGGLYRKSGGAT